MTSTRSWTDADLRAAAATSRTLQEVKAKLGLRPSGGANRTIHRHAARLGIALPLDRRGHRSWTDDQLRQAAAAARSLGELTAALGLAKNGRTNQVLRRHARRLGIALPDGWSPRRRWL
jgi:bacterioferritin-associated ferredoxin